MDRVSAFLWGAVFATGLAISGMIKPSKIIGFLDVAGHWDPTLAFVMGGALAVFLPAYRFVIRRKRPLVAAAFDLPKKQKITWQLVVGAVIFGLGWAVSGFCPAAGVTALPGGSGNAIAVTIGMSVGIITARTVRRRLAPKTTPTVADF